MNPITERSCAFTSTLENVKQFLRAEPSGSRWFKVNLHTHARGHDPGAFIEAARTAELDLIAITDHQSFDAVDPVMVAARAPGRTLIVLPGIEITTHEGVHLLAVFPATQTSDERRALLGFLEIPGTGDTTQASRKGVNDVLLKVHELGGVVVVPHPFTGDIGLLDRARKMNTKVEWLETGHVQLMQLPEDKVTFLGHDEKGQWINRFVLASARPKDIEESNYCLAPFNRSDSHTLEELAEGCSWFRMEEASVEGLKQVACEPRTRISRTDPVPESHDCVLGLRVMGGYCDGQVFRFNERLTCIVGQNYAGKSAVLDFVRFACGQDRVLNGESKKRLLQRLLGILQPDGQIEMYIRRGGDIFVVTRTFAPVTSGYGASAQVDRVTTDPKAYRLADNCDELEPVREFAFQAEVYEQGRISRLRDDVGRQLEMIDEFAGVAPLKSERVDLVRRLHDSAQALAPLYDEREELLAALSGYEVLRRELGEKSALLPASEDEERWARSLGVVGSLEKVIESLETGVAAMPTGHGASSSPAADPLERLFSQSVPQVPSDDHAEHELLGRWVRNVADVVSRIDSAREDIAAAVRGLRASCNEVSERWTAVASKHEQALAEQMKRAGVESPKELLAHLESLRRQVRDIEEIKRPRLDSVREEIRALEEDRNKLLTKLGDVAERLTQERTGKAQDLTAALDGRIRLSIRPAADRAAFRRVLDSLATGVTNSTDRRIRNRDEQLDLVVSCVGPLQLANALCQGGELGLDDGTTSTLVEYCGITNNTSEVLCAIADDVRALNELQSVAVPDIPVIQVQRQGETEYVGLTDGLSPGEQSAAVLSLALGTRTMPLIIDQPEDELGYSYVVHLIVPKMLDSKASRQIIVVTHNANIPVLGDADYVLQMRNTPNTEGGRQCQVATSGCFERVEVTRALLELEGGRQAFQLRRNRYRLHG